MEKQMYNSLLEIKQKFDELSEEVNSPKITSDIKKYRILSKEINDLSNIVKTFNKYLGLEQSVKEAKEMISNEKDKAMIDLAKSDLASSEDKIPMLIEELKLLLLPRDENDDKNVIIEIRGAAGGDEANLFAGDLLTIYKKWAVSNKMKIDFINLQRAEGNGFSLIVFKITGPKAYAKLKFESGVHRVQRVPQTETQGRVHTSTATVTVLPEADETVEIEINTSDLKIDTFRATGAGGQHINTTDSAVRITHLPTNLVVQSQDGRSQLANRDAAMSLLKTKLYDLEMARKQKENASYRKLAGSGARAEKIRTYNFPQDRVTDHRISFSSSLKGILEGKIDPLIDALLAEEQAQKIKAAGI